MRTMLISLILICSLSQLASAGASPTESGGCGTVYKCFAPEKCKDQTVTTMVASEVVEVKNTILDDCDAIIRIYRYDAQKTYVSIESFQDTVKKIEFKQEIEGANENDPRIMLNFFSCEYDMATGKKKGIFFDELVLDEAITPGRLKCIFEHKRDAPYDDGVFMKPVDFLTIVTYQENPSTHAMVAVPTGKDSHHPLVAVRCDPENIEFPKQVIDPTKRYKKVSIKNKPEKYECDEERFIMEFKRKASGNYETVKSMKCVDNGDKFKITAENGETDTFDDSIEMRCVAESKYFCKYKPKVKDNETSLKFEEKTDGNSLKCPEGKPYFVIVGEVDEYYPEKNPEFKCMAFGATTVWTINFDEVYPEDGVAVYCSDKKKCLEPISASAVEQGTLGPDASKFLVPKCFKDGTLKTTDKQVVTNPRCDLSDGTYKYTVGGKEKVIDDNTKFLCEYPPEEDVVRKTNEANKEKLEIGAYVAGGVCAFAIIGAIAASLICMKKKMKRLKKKYEAQEAFNTQWLSNDERAALKNREALLKKKNPPKSGAKSKPGEKYEIMEENALVKYSQYQSLMKVGPSIDARDEKCDDPIGLANYLDKKFERRRSETGVRFKRTVQYNAIYGGRKVLKKQVRKMDLKRCGKKEDKKEDKSKSEDDKSKSEDDK